MLFRITYPNTDFNQYRDILSPQLVENLTSAARDLGEMRIVHVNSTATGGGVAEILQSMVPLMNGLGIATERMVISPPPEFFRVTKRIHNLLQGAEGDLSAQELDIYFQAIQGVADEINRHGLSANIWFLHDPQLLPLARLLPRTGDETRIWVCHIDLTSPNPGVMDTLMPLTAEYDGLVFSLDDYVPDGLGQHPPVFVTPPAIDPFTVKNTPLELDEAQGILSAMGIDTNRPLVTQVSRFDFWKDPWGVVDAFRLARQSVPGLQLALLGLSQATDDPEALDVLNSVREYAQGDMDIHTYFNATGLPASIDKIVNAFQVASTLVLQKSTREGFGLTVSEAMWKGQPMIGGNVGGIRVQIVDGESGYLVNSPEECGQRMAQLLDDPALRRRMGEAARERVRHQFLLPRLTADYLQIAKTRLFRGANGNGAHANGHARSVNGFERLETVKAES